MVAPFPSRHYMQFVILSLVVMFSYRTLEIRFRTTLYDPTPRPVNIFNYTSVQVKIPDNMSIISYWEIFISQTTEL